MVEPRVVIPVVVGSSPIVHPMFQIINRCFAFCLSLYKATILFDNSTLLAKVAELVDALDLGSSAARRAGSSPAFRTTIRSVAEPAGRDGGRRTFPDSRYSRSRARMRPLVRGAPGRMGLRGPGSTGGSACFRAIPGCPFPQAMLPALATGAPERRAGTANAAANSCGAAVRAP